MIDIRHGDCISEMRAMDDACVDAIVTDPPYEIGMMGRKWDSTGIANSVEMWREAYRVLKPGGHMLAFSSTRTYHRMVCAIEDAGFEIRDQIGWMYGSGFPKSRDVSKDIDKAAGAEREVIGSKLGMPGYSLAAEAHNDGWRKSGMRNPDGECSITAPATPEAQKWSGWGTALKPAWEPICVARKPLIGTVVANVLAHGTGAINIDGCRIECGSHEDLNGGRHRGDTKGTDGNAYGAGINRKSAEPYKQPSGRWPANCIHDGSDEVLEAFAAFGSTGAHTAVDARRHTIRDTAGYEGGLGVERSGVKYDAGGTAARFFYSAKASKADRAGSSHPTVKPINLVEYLVRLVTPPGGTVLDPFGGSGTLAAAAHRVGVNAILIEKEAEYYADILRRVEALKTEEQPLDLFRLAEAVA